MCLRRSKTACYTCHWKTLSGKQYKLSTIAQNEFQEGLTFLDVHNLS